MKTPLSRYFGRSLYALGIGCLLSLYAIGADAQDFSLNIDQPNRIVVPGTTEIFSGTITNNSDADILASEISLDFSGYDAVILGPTRLLGDTADFTLADDATSATVALFSLDIAPAAVQGVTYFADVLVQNGEIEPGLSNIVTISVTPVPEPPMAALASAGVILLLSFGVGGRRKKANL